MNSLNKIIVSVYKVIGFAVLTAILAGLGSYMALNLFYLVDTSWLAPATISPTDPRVLQIGVQITQHSSERERLATQRQEQLAHLADLERTAATAKEYQRGFGAALRTDLLAAEQELRRLGGLGDAAEGVRTEISQSRRAYGTLTRERLDELLKARLINQDQFVSGSYQLSQLAHGELALAEDAVKIGQQSATLRRQIESLQQLIAIEGRPRIRAGRAGLSSEALRMKHEHDRAVLEEARAVEAAGATRRGIEAIDRSIADYDRLLRSARSSPLLKAASHNLTVAYLPYENIDRAANGTKLYGCLIGVLLCRSVGRIVDRLPGEVVFTHPFHNRAMRGLAVQVELEDARWAERPVLFSRRLLF